MNDDRSHILLIDGSLYAYRAYHALPNLTSQDGRPTGAIFGVINTLITVFHTLKTNYVVVAFDALHKNFRHELYPDYKRHRQGMMDESLQQQFEVIFYIVEKLGFKCFVIEGYEADDVIGTLAHIYSRQNYQISIMTADKDLIQLVDSNISLIDGLKVINYENAFDKFQVYPHQIVDYLALVGDATDNIPGVKQIGPKTASKLLQDYGSLEQILQHIDDISPKIKQHIIADYDNLMLSKKLATINFSVPINHDLESLHVKKPDKASLIQIFKVLNFNKFIRMLDIEQESNKLIFEVKNIVTASDLLSCQQQIEASKIFSFWLEPSTLRIAIEGLVFQIQAEDDTKWSLDITQFLENIFSLPLEKVTLDLKSQLNLLKTLIDIKYIVDIDDILLESYVYDSSQSPHTIQHIAAKYLGYYKEINKEESALLIIMAHKFFQQQLDQNSKDIYYQQELPLTYVLHSMENKGVIIDLKSLESQDQFLQHELEQLQSQAEAIVGEPFNAASPKQVREILYDKLNLPIIQKTTHLVPSTNEYTLAKLSSLHPLPSILLQHRHISKLRSSYTSKLVDMINTKTCRLHTSYNQNIAITGRLTSSSPNLQNIPIKTLLGNTIRTVFVAEPNYILLSADYSQIELKVMAHLSQDPRLVVSFQNDLDIHTQTAADIFSVRLEQVTSEMRRLAKRINFGLIYGMSAFGLSQQLNISSELAKDYIEKYFNLYPGVKAYMASQILQAQTHGFVETLLKRKISISDILSDNSFIRKGAERLAINAPIQGSAAEIIKKAMNDLYKNILLDTQNIFLLMQVHDELVFEVQENNIQDFIPLIRHTMEHTIALSVPINVNIRWGKNWGDLSSA